MFVCARKRIISKKQNEKKVQPINLFEEERERERGKEKNGNFFPGTLPGMAPYTLDNTQKPIHQKKDLNSDTAVIHPSSSS